jgi:hypothetical protein
MLSADGPRPPMPLCFYAKDAEAAVVVVKGGALDDGRDFLGRGSALLHSGGHEWGFNFATDGWGLGYPWEPILRRFGCREGVPRVRGFTPTCIARKAIRATQPTGIAGQASPCAGSRSMRNGWVS